MAEGYINGKLDLAWWTKQITAGVEYRKKFAHESKWQTWRDFYRGNWKDGVLPSNVYFKMLRTIVPRVYFRNPSISLQATKPGIEHMLFAQLLERIDNKLIKRMKLKKQLKMMVQDAFMFGTAVGKLGFGAEFTPSPDEVETDQPFDKSDRVVEYNQNVHANMPWFMRVHPGAFIVPAGVMDFDDARFAIHWIRRSLADVKDDPRLKNVSGLSGSTRGTMSGDSGTTGAYKESKGYRNPTEMIDLYEIRDKKTRKVFVIAPFATDKVLYEGTDDLQFQGRLPFYTIVFNADDDVFWGVPDSQILEPIQLEMNEIRTQIMKHRRLSLVKILAKVNSMEEGEAEKLVNEDVAPVIFIKGEVQTDVKFLEGSNIPRDLFVAFEATVFDARETVGFSRNEFGEFNSRSGDTSATEATIVKQASEIRVDERRDMVADIITDLVEHMHTIIFEHWTDEQVMEVMGPGGVPIWIKFKPSMLKSGAYEVSVDPDTSVPDTKQARQNKAAQIFGLFKGDPLIDQMKLRRYLLHEMHGTVFDDMLVFPGLGTPTNPVDMAQAISIFSDMQAGVKPNAGGGGANAPQPNAGGNI